MFYILQLQNYIIFSKIRYDITILTILILVCNSWWKFLRQKWPTFYHIKSILDS